MNRPWLGMLSIIILLSLSITARSKDPVDGITKIGDKVAEKINRVTDSVGRFNVRSKTLGGKQFWTDYLVQHDLRIQRNEVSNHYRLLDGRNYRLAWGTFPQCKESLKKLSEKKQLPDVKGTVVLLLHGLGRTRSSMGDLQKRLDEQPGVTALSLSYASTRAPIEQHAEALGSVIKNLPQAKEINLVAHSMGNLVIRHYLSREQGADQRIKRIVMLAPPNQGAALATLFKDNHLFHIFWGTSGEEIAVDWDQLVKKLAIPECEFGIIAGGNFKSFLSNPLIKGEDDFVLRVEETKLAGARDFAIVPAYHGRIMSNSLVKSYTVKFLRSGYFISEVRRQPILPSETDDQ